MDRTPEDRAPAGDRTCDVQVWISSGPPDSRRGRVAVRLLVALALAAVVAAFAAIAVDSLRERTVAAATRQSPTDRIPAIAAVYRYPLGCLGASLSGSDQARVSKRYGRTSPCWHYGVYVTAILRPVRGSWRLALKAISPACPKVVLPAIVRAQLAVCRR